MGSPYYHIKLMFEKIVQKLDVLEARISAVAQDLKMPRGKSRTVYLSVGQQATVDALKNFAAPVSAEQISAVTGRARAVESKYLNELFRSGLAAKEKRGRMRVFGLKEE